MESRTEKRNTHSVAIININVYRMHSIQILSAKLLKEQKGDETLITHLWYYRYYLGDYNNFTTP